MTTETPEALAVLDAAVQSIQFDYGLNGAKEIRKARAAFAAEHAELVACKQFLEDMHTQTPEWSVAESQLRHVAVSKALAAVEKLK